MATKKKVVKSYSDAGESRIVPAQKAPLTVAAVEAGLSKLFESFAHFISAAKDEEMPEALAFVRKSEALLEDTGKLVKERVKALVLQNGTKATEAGTKRLTIGGYVLEVQPAATGYDGKRVEALLRAKNIYLDQGMDSTVSWKVNEGKLENLVREKKLSNQELKTCLKDESWKVMSPKKEE